MKALKFIIFLTVINLITSCKKEKLDDCFTSAGEFVSVERPASYFHSVNMRDNVNLIIKSGDNFSIETQGGRNLVDAIGTEIKDSILFITNSLLCNWVRDYDNPLNVVITSPALKDIRYESSGDISTDELLIIDELAISVWGGGGSINLELDCRILDLGLHYGTVDFNVKGKSKMTTIYANSYGPFYCNLLDSEIVYIRNQGTNDCYIHANHILEAVITSIGSIYYSGNPYDLKCTDTGKGELIKLN
ncbi:MAG TPA: DUF2807 domain-containing protein [Lentimicrobium sp.]|nr:DUF2807 domain-containing protein [Lentimicrobium sp.]